MSDPTFRFQPVPTISALDLALILAASGAMQNVPYALVASLPFDTARHFQPNASQLTQSAGPKLVLTEETKPAGVG